MDLYSIDVSNLQKEVNNYTHHDSSYPDAAWWRLFEFPVVFNHFVNHLGSEVG